MFAARRKANHCRQMRITSPCARADRRAAVSDPRLSASAYLFPTACTATKQLAPSQRTPVIPSRPNLSAGAGRQPQAPRYGFLKSAGEVLRTPPMPAGAGNVSGPMEGVLTLLTVPKMLGTRTVILQHPALTGSLDLLNGICFQCLSIGLPSAAHTLASRTLMPLQTSMANQ